jgi:predicted kinase
MNKELIMLVGLPGCGKSTYRKPHAMDFISSDHFIEEFAQAAGKTYGEVFAGFAKQAEVLMYAHMDDLLANGTRQIVWDQTNLNAKTRQKKLQKFNEAGGKDYRKIALFFEPDMQLTLARNEERRAFGRDIPLHVLESMYDSIEVPKKAEGFDYVFHVPLDSQI